MVLFPYIAGLFGTLAIFLLLVLFMNYRNINTLINPVLVLSQHMLMAAKGNLDEALLFCGANAWKAEKLEHVADIMEELK